MNSIKKILSIALFALALVPACKGMDLHVIHRPAVTLINAAAADPRSLVGRPYSVMGTPGTITKVDPWVVSDEGDIAENMHTRVDTVPMEVTAQGKYLDVIYKIKLTHEVTKTRYVNAEELPAIEHESGGDPIQSIRCRCTTLGMVTSATCALVAAGLGYVTYQLQAHGLF